MAFTFKLVHPDGTPADPPTLRSAVPNWQVGDTFMHWRIYPACSPLASMSLPRLQQLCPATCPTRPRPLCRSFPRHWVRGRSSTDVDSVHAVASARDGAFAPGTRASSPICASSCWCKSGIWGCLFRSPLHHSGTSWMAGRAAERSRVGHPPFGE